MGQRPIQENQVADFALRKVGGEVTDASLDPTVTSYPEGLLEINRTRSGGPSLRVSHSNASEIQIEAAGGSFQVNNLGQVNGQTIDSTTILSSSQKTKLIGGGNADDLHSHDLPTFFHYHGTISDGAQLQLPPGFTADDVHYIVSARHYEIDNLLSNTSFQFDAAIDNNRFVTLEVKQPSTGSNIALNATLNYFITAYKLTGTQTGGPTSSGGTSLLIKQATGYWDGEADIDFSTGQINIKPSSFSFYNTNGSLIPKSQYFGDVFDDPAFPPPKIVWSIVNENNTSFEGGISDRAWIDGIDNIGGESAASASLGGLQFSGGVKSKFVVPATSHFCGRIAFYAFSSAVV